MGPLLHFGDELECHDVSALEQVIAHLARSDPQLLSFSVRVAPLNAVAAGVWSTEGAEWQSYDATNRAQLDLLASSSYGASEGELTPQLLVVDRILRSASGAHPPGERPWAAMALYGTWIFFHPAQRVAFVVQVGRTSDEISHENALRLVSGRCLLPYLGEPRWSLDRINSRVGEQFEAARIAESLLNEMACEREPGVAGWTPDCRDFEYVSLVAAEAYSRWANAGYEFIRYYGQRSIRVTRSRATLLRRYRTIGDWVRHAWTDRTDFVDIACAFAEPGKNVTAAPVTPASCATLAPGKQPGKPTPSAHAASDAPALRVSSLFNLALQIGLTNRFSANQPHPSVRDELLLQRRFADGRIIRGLLALQDHRLCLDVMSC